LMYHHYVMSHEQLRSSDAFTWRYCVFKTVQRTGLPCPMFFWCYEARAYDCLHLAYQLTTQMSI
jgi:hypothetical protein